MSRKPASKGANPPAGFTEPLTRQDVGTEPSMAQGSASGRRDTPRVVSCNQAPSRAPSGEGSDLPKRQGVSHWERIAS
jgi:hypothetical protein